MCFHFWTNEFHFFITLLLIYKRHPWGPRHYHNSYSSVQLYITMQPNPIFKPRKKKANKCKVKKWYNFDHAFVTCVLKKNTYMYNTVGTLPVVILLFFSKIRSFFSLFSVCQNYLLIFQFYRNQQNTVI